LPYFFSLFSIYDLLLKVKTGVFITHTYRVLKPNLEDLFQMRQMSACGQGWIKG